MSWDDYATGGQIHRLALLAALSGIPYPIEDREMTRAQARNEVYLLRNRLRSKKNKEELCQRS